MSCQFDQYIERRNTCSRKWDDIEELFGKDDVLPMWIADMDFRPPRQVVEAVTKRATHGIYGYETESAGYLEAVLSWLQKRYDWRVNRDWVVHSPGVVPGLAFAVNALTEPGDRIVIQPPVYPPFYSVVRENGRQLVESPLILSEGKFSMDFASLERHFSSGIKFMIFCSPHNPVGRVWTKIELEKLAQLAVKYDVIVLSDEIWSDLVFPGHQHLPLADIAPEMAERTLTFMAPSKTFNVAGLYLSNIIIPNEEYREKFCGQISRLGLSPLNVFGLVAGEAAYRHGEEWLEELLAYLKKNALYVKEGLAKITSKIEVIEPEGTFVLWLDCRRLGIPPEELNDFFISEVGIAFNDGEVFGEAGRGFQRMNIGCPTSLIDEALKRLAKVLS